MNEAKSAEDFPGEVSSFEQDALCFGSAVGLVCMTLELRTFLCFHLPS